MNDDALSMILAAVTRLEGKTDRLENNLASLRVDIMERLDRHENKLGSIHEDIAVDMGANEQMRRHSENTRDELRALNAVVTLMQKQIMRLQARVDELGL